MLTKPGPQPVLGCDHGFASQRHEGVHQLSRRQPLGRSVHEFDGRQCRVLAIVYQLQIAQRGEVRRYGGHQLPGVSVDHL